MKLRKQQKQTEFMDARSWLEYGWSRGWCGPDVCVDHDGIPMTEEENDLAWNGDEICVFIVRLYEDDEIRRAVEEAHAPTMWRASNNGWKRNEP